MKLIVLDFVSRWWWVLLGCCLVIATAAAFDRGVPLAPAALLCFMFDWQRGQQRVVRPLPVSLRHQALASWFICVGLLPLLGLVAIIAGAWAGGLHSFHQPDLFITFVTWRAGDGSWPAVAQSLKDAWFSIAMGWWLGLGFSALLFLAQVQAPQGRLLSRYARIWAAITAMFVGLMFPGVMMLAMWMPGRGADMRPLQWAVCATVPLWVVWSLVEALRRPCPLLPQAVASLAATSPSLPATGKAGRGGLQGMAALLVMMHARLLGMLVMMALMYVGMTNWFMKTDLRGAEATMSPQLMIMGATFCAILPDIWNLRSLRMLPLSTTKLALLLLSVPVVMGMAVGFLCRFCALSVDPAASAAHAWIAGMLAVAFGSLGISAGVLFSLAKRLLFAVVLFVGIGATGIFGFKVMAAWLPVLAVAMLLVLVLSYAVLHRGLRRSSAVYQPRRLPGAWGQMPMRG